MCSREVHGEGTGEGGAGRFVIVTIPKRDWEFQLYLAKQQLRTLLETASPDNLKATRSSGRAKASSWTERHPGWSRGF